jgi:predicted RNase H-like HicB family nuclease
MTAYCVLIEKTDNGYSAYVPDLPGCIAAGDNKEETKELIRQATIYYLETLKEYGEPIPEPETTTALVVV